MLWTAVAALALSSGGVAFGASDGLLTLDGSGYAVMPNSVDPVLLDLNVVASSTALTVTSGSLVYDGAEFDSVSINASFLRDAKFLRLSGIAERNNDSVIISLLGRLVQEKGGESLYIVTGTLRHGEHDGKTVFAASLSSSDAMATTAKVIVEPLLVSILPEPRNEGAPLGHINRPSIQTLVGQSVTITNTDTIPHRFVSGSLHEWLYERDGAPRVCDSEENRDGAEEPETQTGSYLDSGESFSYTVPTPKESPGFSASDPVVIGCDFVRDGITDITLHPGASASVSAPSLGFYRLLDVTSPWIQLEIISVIEIKES